jgi:hypothetical protein
MRSRICLPLVAVSAVLASAQTITLTAEKRVYLEDDVRALHEATFAPSGERVVLKAVIEGLDWAGPGCPLLTELVRLPDDSERNDELGPRAKCSQHPGGLIEVKFDAGHVTDWYGLGEYHVRLVLGGKNRDPNKTFPISNEIALTTADAATTVAHSRLKSFKITNGAKPSIPCL